NPPILYNYRTGEMRFLKVGGTLVGMFENMEYEEDRVKLYKGDVMVMYTDGITEASNSSGEMFGEERLKQIIIEGERLSAMQLLQRIYDEVKRFSEGMPQQDDLTLIVMRIT
ncbi:TPA: serine/threonine-protein phosphatase, partial [Candidatus Poribacteria bacterium]|nr:serine/threonine-protein phosphatase [Candidatus Poribacteria bacterium]HEX28924.1 serine/threonine-protein phosphatase [Candidatus Poribacteria bacterium]